MDFKIKNILKILFINLVIIILIDLAAGIFLPKLPENINKGWGAGGPYVGNYRNYFVPTNKYRLGKQLFKIDRKSYHLWKRKNNAVVSGKTKVLFIGDSFTEGQGVMRKDTYPKVIEQISPKIVSYNRGKGGANIEKIADIFSKIHSVIKPKITVYGYVLNDPLVEPSTESMSNIDSGKDHVFKWDFINLRTSIFDSSRSSTLKILCKYSNILNYAIKIYERRSVASDTIAHYRDIHDSSLNEKGLLATIELIQKIKKEASEHGGEFLVAVFPIFYKTQGAYPFKSVHKTIKNRLEALNIKVIDLLSDYEGIEDHELWAHPTDQHPNDYAHKIAARRILKEINKILGP